MPCWRWLVYAWPTFTLLRIKLSKALNIFFYWARQLDNAKYFFFVNFYLISFNGRLTITSDVNDGRCSRSSSVLLYLQLFPRVCESSPQKNSHEIPRNLPCVCHEDKKLMILISTRRMMIYNENLTHIMVPFREGSDVVKRLLLKYWYSAFSFK
jgi:hypothetical protein